MRTAATAETLNKRKISSSNRILRLSLVRVFSVADMNSRKISAE